MDEKKELLAEEGVAGGSPAAENEGAGTGDHGGEKTANANPGGNRQKQQPACAIENGVLIINKPITPEMILNPGKHMNAVEAERFREALKTVHTIDFRGVGTKLEFRNDPRRHTDTKIDLYSDALAAIRRMNTEHTLYRVRFSGGNINFHDCSFEDALTPVPMGAVEKAELEEEYRKMLASSAEAQALADRFAKTGESRRLAETRDAVMVPFRGALLALASDGAAEGLIKDEKLARLIGRCRETTGDAEVDALYLEEAVCTAFAIYAEQGGAALFREGADPRRLLAAGKEGYETLTGGLDEGKRAGYIAAKTAAGAKLEELSDRKYGISVLTETGDGPVSALERLAKELKEKADRIKARPNHYEVEFAAEESPKCENGHGPCGLGERLAVPVFAKVTYDTAAKTHSVATIGEYTLAGANVAAFYCDPRIKLVCGEGSFSMGDPKGLRTLIKEHAGEPEYIASHLGDHMIGGTFENGSDVYAAAKSWMAENTSGAIKMLNKQHESHDFEALGRKAEENWDMDRFLEGFDEKNRQDVPETAMKASDIKRRAGALRKYAESYGSLFLDRGKEIKSLLAKANAEDLKLDGEETALLADIAARILPARMAYERDAWEMRGAGVTDKKLKWRLDVHGYIDNGEWLKKSKQERKLMLGTGRADSTYSLMPEGWHYDFNTERNISRVLKRPDVSVSFDSWSDRHRIRYSPVAPGVTDDRQKDDGLRFFTLYDDSGRPVVLQSELTELVARYNRYVENQGNADGEEEAKFRDMVSAMNGIPLGADGEGAPTLFGLLDGSVGPDGGPKADVAVFSRRLSRFYHIVDDEKTEKRIRSITKVLDGQIEKVFDFLDEDMKALEKHVVQDGTGADGRAIAKINLPDSGFCLKAIEAIGRDDKNDSSFTAVKIDSKLRNDLITADMGAERTRRVTEFVNSNRESASFCTGALGELAGKFADYGRNIEAMTSEGWARGTVMLDSPDAYYGVASFSGRRIEQMRTGTATAAPALEGLYRRKWQMLKNLGAGAFVLGTQLANGEHKIEDPELKARVSELCGGLMAIELGDVLDPDGNVKRDMYGETDKRLAVAERLIGAYVEDSSKDADGAAKSADELTLLTSGNPDLSWDASAKRIKLAAELDLMQRDVSAGHGKKVVEYKAGAGFDTLAFAGVKGNADGIAVESNSSEYTLEKFEIDMRNEDADALLHDICSIMGRATEKFDRRTDYAALRSEMQEYRINTLPAEIRTLSAELAKIEKKEHPRQHDEKQKELRAAKNNLLKLNSLMTAPGGHDTESELDKAIRTKLEHSAWHEFNSSELQYGITNNPKAIALEKERNMLASKLGGTKNEATGRIELSQLPARTEHNGEMIDRYQEIDGELRNIWNSGGELTVGGFAEPGALGEGKESVIVGPASLDMNAMPGKTVVQYEDEGVKVLSDGDKTRRMLTAAQKYYMTYSFVKSLGTSFGRNLVGSIEHYTVTRAMAFAILAVLLAAGKSVSFVSRHGMNVYRTKKNSLDAAYLALANMIKDPRYTGLTTDEALEKMKDSGCIDISDDGRNVTVKLRELPDMPNEVKRVINNTLAKNGATDYILDRERTERLFSDPGYRERMAIHFTHRLEALDEAERRRKEYWEKHRAYAEGKVSTKNIGRVLGSEEKGEVRKAARGATAGRTV